MGDGVHIFGIRHHGPGCARSLRSALAALDPECLLIEGPPDAEAVLPLVIDPAMSPPVALLIYPEGAPERAVYYPFAEFSPEWQAIRYGLEREIPVRFMDLPLTHRFAEEDRIRAEAEEAAKTAGEQRSEGMPAEPCPPGQAPSDLTEGSGEPDDVGDDDSDAAAREDLHIDPLGVLAEAAGYTDRELWWEHMVEQRVDPAGLFDGIQEAMTALREKRPPPAGEEALREAYMRRVIREAKKAGHARIAVVCGAWHGPALTDLKTTTRSDTALLKGLGKTKIVATWIPWTHDRLTTQSGYGAGIASPGWYQHLWQAPDRAAIRWTTLTARLLRERDLDASSASVIEAVRLAEALATLRGLPLPGLAELREAIQTVLCHGEASPMQLIARHLEIGDVLGEVPEGAPTVPLQQDLALAQKRLRLKASAEIRDLDLDLRKDTDRARSTLLHRLRLLEVAWGDLSQGTGTSGKGSFREGWRIQWKPELAVAVIEANLFGNTVESAAIEKVRRRAAIAPLGELTALLEALLPADLEPALEPVLARLQAAAAVTADVRELMRALPPLARVSRYGDVRGDHSARLAPVLDGLLGRVLIGLVPAAASLDDAAADELLKGLGEVHEAVALLDREDHRKAFLGALASLMQSGPAHPRIRGRAARLRIELRDLDEDELARVAALALSRAADPREAATWSEGLLRGTGLLLLHQDGVWRVLDAWLRELAADAFAAIVPVLRRAFSEFTDPERRSMGDKVKTLAVPEARSSARASARATTVDLEPKRAARVLGVLAQILGEGPPPAAAASEGDER